MRLLLKTKMGILSPYWIKFENAKILGWCAGRAIQKMVGVSERDIPEIKFDYPEDGDFHITYKVHQTDPQQFIKITWDKIKIKTVSRDRGSDTKEFDRKDFESSSESIFLFPMIEYRPLPIREVLRFQFPLIAFCVVNGYVNDKLFEKLDSIRKDDLLIDIRDKNKICVNAHAYLRKQTEPMMKFVGMTSYTKTISIFDTHMLDLICAINPN